VVVCQQLFLASTPQVFVELLVGAADGPLGQFGLQDLPHGGAKGAQGGGSAYGQEVEEELVQEAVHELEGRGGDQGRLPRRLDPVLFKPGIGLAVVIIGDDLRGRRRGDKGGFRINRARRAEQDAAARQRRSVARDAV
jgi:hypothetical protein